MQQLCSVAKAFDAPASKAAYNAFVNAQDELKRRTTTTTTTVTTENAEQKALKDRLDKLEDMLENDNGDKYATVEELQSVASSLNDIAGSVNVLLPCVHFLPCFQDVLGCSTRIDWCC